MQHLQRLSIGVEGRRRKLLLTVLFALTAAVAVLAAPTAAHVGNTPIVNGDFESGDLSGWTTFTTANGAIGAPGVVLFDTTGTEVSKAAQLNVGLITYPPFLNEGGGIYQTVNAAGSFSLSADIAAANVRPVGSGDNGECGFFELLLDGSVVASHDFGSCDAGATVRSTLMATGLSLSPGSHEIRIRITRPYISHPAPDDANGTQTPFQYIDNVRLTATLPTTRAQCINDGWQSFGVFKNQGDCVSYVATGGKNTPANP
jgi:hypothetical protein